MAHFAPMFDLHGLKNRSVLTSHDLLIEFSKFVKKISDSPKTNIKYGNSKD